MKYLLRLAPLALLNVIACSDVEVPEGCHTHGDEVHCDYNHGLATTVTLNFTPTAGGDALRFEWSDPENDGDPVVDDIVLPDSVDEVAQEYTVSIEVWNELEDPAADVTPEIEEGAEEHQFFFTGSAVQGPATGDNPDALLQHAYADTDADGLPVGLINTFTALDVGTGELTVTLRHLPPEGGASIKVEGLADDVAANGFGSIGGANDIQVTFNLEVE